MTFDKVTVNKVKTALLTWVSRRPSWVFQSCHAILVIETFVLFCSVLFCSVLFGSVLFCSVLFCSVPFCFVLSTALPDV